MQIAINQEQGRAGCGIVLSFLDNVLSSPKRDDSRNSSGTTNQSPKQFGIEYFGTLVFDIDVDVLEGTIKHSLTRKRSLWKSRKGLFDWHVT